MVSAVDRQEFVHWRLSATNGRGFMGGFENRRLNSAICILRSAFCNRRTALFTRRKRTGLK
jgi:hypothetical protein